MRIAYISTLCFALICLNIFGAHARAKKNALAKAIHELILVVTMTVLSSMLAIFTPSEDVALFLQCLHFATTEWLLIYLLRFLEEYTGEEKSNKKSRIIIIIFAIANTISLALNSVFGHILSCETEELASGMIVNSFITHSPWYNFHLYFSYVLVAFNMLFMLGKEIQSPRLYKRKYHLSFTMLCITIIVDVFCTIMKFPLDYSLYFYILLAAFLTYYSLYHVQGTLISQTMTYVVADSMSGVVCFNAEGKCIFVNEQAQKLYDNPEDISEYKSIFQKELSCDYFEVVEEQRWNLEFYKSEGTLYYEANFCKLFDESNKYIGCYFHLIDKTKDVLRLEEEKYRARHDSLTDLFTREYFYKEVRKKMDDHPEEEYYMICTNFMDFKLINELFGFEIGNQILREFAQNIKNSSFDAIVTGRLHGDHFGICIPKRYYDETYLLEALDRVSNLISSSEYQIHMHAGVYVISPEDQDVSVMCDRANMAIDTIKHDYEKVIAFYDDSLMKKVLQEKHLVGEFDSALEEGQFAMYLQPQVLPNGRVVGAEALVRWIHPELGMISPGVFIPVFEQSGIIHKLDMFIWEEAAKKLKEWKKQGREDLHISVNISTKDFYYVDVYKIFTELVEKYEIDPYKLKLEITETALMMEQEKQFALFERLQQYGFNIEIDDFGSGYSSLNMLKDLRADVLKLDMGFLRETAEKERTRIILAMIVEMAKQLQMIVISEGVENKEQVDYLTETGCDMFQGYYFARPIAISEFERKYLVEKN